MKFVSFAQNFEDVMLWRALKHIQDGFYVDVGAFSPDLDSVTKAFYNAGWSGINIEPNPDFTLPYQVNRPRDILVTNAVSDSSGEREIYVVPSTGLTSMDQEVAGHHADNGWTVEPIKVQVCTLADILEEHALDRDIHFLKIDVEGFEENVIRGNDWERFRPWILVIEATFPMSQIESHASWEPLILEAGYHFAYADGLNRFYIANSHLELKAAFNYPPNVFDEFISCDLLDSTNHCELLKQEKMTLQRNIQTLSDDKHASEEKIAVLNTRLADSLQQRDSELQEIERLRSENQGLQDRIDSFIHSCSWRMTRPLRAVAKLLRQ
jgi:FkbM family methyltransferase